jgi:hypothetical protein
MSPRLLDAHVALLAASAAAGIVFGRLYFDALRRSVAAYASTAGRARSVALTIGRIVCAVAFFAVASRLGALPLLLALLGFLAARSLALRTARRAPL